LGIRVPLPAVLSNELAAHLFPNGFGIEQQAIKVENNGLDRLSRMPCRWRVRAAVRSHLFSLQLSVEIVECGRSYYEITRRSRNSSADSEETLG
jgi:hypothetical protein